MPPKKLLRAYTLLNCTHCGWQLYILVDEPDAWDGKCPRCRCDTFRWGGSRVARRELDLAVIHAEGQIANLDMPEEHAGVRVQERE